MSSKQRKGGGVVVNNPKNLNFASSSSDVGLQGVRLVSSVAGGGGSQHYDDEQSSILSNVSETSSISLQEQHEQATLIAERILLAFYAFASLTIAISFCAALIVPKYQNTRWMFSQISSWSAITHELYFLLCIFASIFKKKIPRRFFLHRDRFFTLCFPLSLYTMIFYVAFVIPFSIRFLDIREDCVDPNECISVAGFVAVSMLNIYPFLLILIDTSLNSHRNSYKNHYSELILTVLYIVVYLLASILYHTLTEEWPTYVERELAHYPAISVIAHIAAVCAFISFYFLGRCIIVTRRQREAQKHFADSLLESIEDAWSHNVPPATFAQYEITSHESSPRGQFV